MKLLHKYSMKEERFRVNLGALSLHNVFEMVNISFPISAIAMAIPGRSSRRAHVGSFTVRSEEMKTKILLCYLHKCKKHGKENRRSG